MKGSLALIMLAAASLYVPSAGAADAEARLGAASKGAEAAPVLANADGTAAGVDARDEDTGRFVFAVCRPEAGRFPLRAG
jgi:hypothetical protein